MSAPTTNGSPGPLDGLLIALEWGGGEEPFIRGLGRRTARAGWRTLYDASVRVAQALRAQLAVFRSKPRG